MGDTISSLVFRPPKPTPIHPSEYFYLDVDVVSPLSANSTSNAEGNDRCLPVTDTAHDGSSCGSVMCLETGDDEMNDLVMNDNTAYNDLLHNSATRQLPQQQRRVTNIRNGQVYKIPAFFIRRRNATQTLLFSHGNAEDLGMMYGRMRDLAMVLGVNVMAYDYTGYGLSVPGASVDGNGGGGGEGPSEELIYRNIEAAYGYLTRTRGIPPHQIILYGRSLGSGPSVYLAAKTALDGQSVGGLILHSPFLSVYKVVADLNGLDLGLVGDLFHNEKRARNVRCPTLIIHGKRDEVVPFWHAPRLLAAIPPEYRAVPYYVEGMGHNHIESRCREQYVGMVLNFLRMGVWNNNRQRSASAMGYPMQGNGSNALTSVVRRGPSPIPIHERASAMETKENTSFYVNKTWLRHAKVLLREVFADVPGCHNASRSVNLDDSRDGRWEQRSRSSSAIGSSARSGSSSSGRGQYGAGTTGVIGGSSRRELLSDARDDVDEFAPWRGNHQATTAQANQYSPRRRQQQQCAQPGQKILTTRPYYGSDPNGTSPNTGYHRAKSMPAMMDRVGQFGDMMGHNVHNNSSPSRPKSPRSRWISQKQTAGYNKSKSMSLNLVGGLGRSNRY